MPSFWRLAAPQARSSDAPSARHTGRVTEQEPPEWTTRIARAQRLLEQQLDEDVSLDDLAAEACYSPFHFHRLFRAATGETVRQHVRRLRLERAAGQLVHTQDEILGIALAAGYGSHEAFTRAFQAHFDASPSTFRAEQRTIRHTPAPTMTDAPVRLETRPAAHIAYVRHVGPYIGAKDAWQSLMKWGWKRMIFGKPELFGLAYDDPQVTDESQCRYEACMEVKAGTKVKPPVETREQPGGTYAVYTHKGPYEEFAQAYANLVARIESGPIDGQQVCFADPPALEKYLNDPRKVKPEDLVSEIWMPVKPV